MSEDETFRAICLVFSLAMDNDRPTTVKRCPKTTLVGILAANNRPTAQKRTNIISAKR